MLVGQVADTVAGLVLTHARKSGVLPLQDKVETVARDLAVKSLEASSRNALVLQAGKVPPFGANVLNDHAWSTEPTMPDEQLVTKVVEAAKAFAESGVVKKLVSAPVNKWAAPRKREDPRPEAWRLRKDLVSSAPDSWLEEEDRFVVLDWKAARQVGRDDAFQLAVYGLWAVHERGWAPEKVSQQVVLMPLMPDFNPVPLGTGAMEIAADIIHEDCARERAMVEVDTDRSGFEVYIAERERFPAQPNPVECGTCRYRAICTEAI